MRALLAALALAVLPGCPDPATARSEGPAACLKIGAQCKMPNGVLGICDAARPGSAELVCAPQH